MELTYTNANGESVTLRQTRPFFLTRVDGDGKVRQTVNTFKAPDQDGSFFISSAMDMRNITLEGSVMSKQTGRVLPTPRTARITVRQSVSLRISSG